jgi:hypothetical protein
MTNEEKIAFELAHEIVAACECRTLGNNYLYFAIDTAREMIRRRDMEADDVKRRALESELSDRA